MKNRFFLFLLLLIVTNVEAQTYRIDSLKKALLTMNNRRQVNCLNALGLEYTFNFIHSDSALKYATLAYKNASIIQYNSGKAEALTTEADVMGRLLGHPKVMELYSMQAIQLLGSEDDPKNLSTAFHKLSIAYTIQGIFDSALDAAFKAKQIAIKAKYNSGIAWATHVIGYVYCQKGDYWNAFENFIESQKMGKELNDSLLTSSSLAFIGRLYNRAGDPQSALGYYY